MTHEDLIDKYNLDKYKLDILYQHIVFFLEEMGLTILYDKLDKIIEVDIYKIDRAISDVDKHHESCLSDGKDLWLHEDMEDIGGITGRLYDILHVGCGHLFQWSADESSNLQFFGEHAWQVGSNFYSKATDKDLQTARKYEYEAGMLALANLKKLLHKHQFDEEFSLAVTRLFTDYLNTDVDYILSFYETGDIKNIFDKWQFNSSALPEINLNFPLVIKRRTNKCVSLLSQRIS